MLTVPNGLTEAHRTVFYRLVALDTALQRACGLPSETDINGDERACVQIRAKKRVTCHRRNSVVGRHSGGRRRPARTSCQIGVPRRSLDYTNVVPMPDSAYYVGNKFRVPRQDAVSWVRAFCDGLDEDTRPHAGPGESGSALSGAPRPRG